MEEIFRSPSARLPAPMPEQAPRRNTPSILEAISFAPPFAPNMNLSAQRVTITSPIVTTEPAAKVCYVCRMQGHTASCCNFAAINQVTLRPMFCGPEEQARRQRWFTSGTHGPYPFSTSPPFARLRFSEVPASALTADNDEELNEEERSASVTEVRHEEVEQRRSVTEVRQEEVEQRRPSEARHQQQATWQQLENTAKEMQREAQALLVEAKNKKKREDLMKDIQKDEKAASEARDRAEKSKKRLRDMDNGN